MPKTIEITSKTEELDEENIYTLFDRELFKHIKHQTSISDKLKTLFELHNS